jgi:hypothetical protein
VKDLSILIGIVLEVRDWEVLAAAEKRENDHRDETVGVEKRMDRRGEGTYGRRM